MLTLWIKQSKYMHFCSLNFEVLFFLNPSLNFKEVTYELDHPGFQISDIETS